MLLLCYIGILGLGTPSRYLARTISWNACTLLLLLLLLLLLAYCRLYSHATENQAKLAEARRARDAETNLNAQASRHSMTWVSQELTKGRNNGEYSNYGERLYVEGMLEHEKKKAAVWPSHAATCN